jgi:iron complex transport system substrate-binding protein
MALPSSFVGNIVEMLGADNIAKNVKPLKTMPRFAPLSLEYVMGKDPDVVLVITHGDDDRVEEKFKRELSRHPAWGGLRAVREGRLYILPFELFGVNPAIRVADAVEYIARLMYPEVFR